MTVQNNFKKNYYELFGLPESFEVDKKHLREQYRNLLKETHPDRFVNSSPQEQRMAVQYSSLINEAQQTLLSPVKRAAYLLSLNDIDVDFENNTAMSPEFLMKQMMLREKLAEAQDDEPRQKVAAEIEHEYHNLELELTLCFRKNDFEKAKQLTRELRFLEKLLAEL